jgi:transposase
MKSRRHCKLVVHSESKPIIASLDVHDHNYYLYCVDTSTGEILADCNLPGNPQATITHLKKIKCDESKTLIIYEAGNPGFYPYRKFTKSGFDCKVIVPSSIPKRAKRFKTDRTDAINNLNYHCSGLLRYVHIPSQEDESNRELLRYRFDLSYQISKQKQKILAMVKRTGATYELTKSNWTKKHYQWLRTFKTSTVLRTLLNLMLDNLDALDLQMKALEKEIDIMLKSDIRYTTTVTLLSVIPGFGDVYAATAALEIQDYNRFKHPNSLMSYIGLIPGKHASGKSDPARAITKAGNKFLRLAYVGAAKSYRDRRMMKQLKSIKALPQPLQPFIS